MRVFSEHNTDGIFNSELHWLSMSPCLGALLGAKCRVSWQRESPHS